MTYQEAKEDGISVINENDCSAQMYCPPCQYCGRPVYTWSYQRKLRYTCPVCKRNIGRQKTGQSVAIKEKKLGIAIKRVAKVTNVAPYEKAIGYIRRTLDRPGWYQSTEEIMVAMELIRRGVKAHHQVKVFDYKVDFVLDDLKVILEIDGSIFHGKEKAGQTQTRDNVIRWKFGEGWEVVHISTDCINEDITKLMPAIRVLLRRRKKLQSESLHMTSR